MKNLAPLKKFFFFLVALQIGLIPFNPTFSQGKNPPPKSPFSQFDPFFEDFEKEIEKFFKRFRGMDEDFMDDFFNGEGDSPFDSFFGRRSRIGKWEETKDQITYRIKGELVKDTPLDIKVKEGKLVISGTFLVQGPRGGIQKSPLKVNQTLPIPENADPETLKVVPKKGEILIIFGKRDPQKTPRPKKLFPVRPPGGKQI